jgi:cytochrome c556
VSHLWHFRVVSPAMGDSWPNSLTGESEMGVGQRILSLSLSMAVSASIIATWPVAPARAASGEEVIKARVNFMEEEIGREWKVLANFAKNGKGSLADVEKSANTLIALAKKIPGHFPKDTGRGNFPDDATRALPEIWKDPSGFEKAIHHFSDQSTKLAGLAKAGDKEAAVNMIGTSGSYAKSLIGCNDCHESFRGARVKK